MAFLCPYNQRKLSKVYTWINDHQNEEFSIRKLSRSVGLSRIYCAQVLSLLSNSGYCDRWKRAHSTKSGNYTSKPWVYRFQQPISEDMIGIIKDYQYPLHGILDLVRRKGSVRRLLMSLNSVQSVRLQHY
jgi:hypothetical protein